jgi:hypothetical protein
MSAVAVGGENTGALYAVVPAADCIGTTSDAMIASAVTTGRAVRHLLDERGSFI